MNKFRYIGEWTTYVKKGHSGRQEPVSKWETITTDLDVKFMLRNKFVLVLEESEQSAADYKNALDVQNGILEGAKDAHGRGVKLLKEKIAIHEKELKETEEAVALVIATAKKDYSDKLNLLLKEDDKEIVAKATKQLKELGAVVKVETPKVEDPKELEEAKKYLDTNGVKYHHMLGLDKLLLLVEEHKKSV